MNSYVFEFINHMGSKTFPGKSTVSSSLIMFRTLSPVCLRDERSEGKWVWRSYKIWSRICTSTNWETKLCLWAQICLGPPKRFAKHFMVRFLSVVGSIDRKEPFKSAMVVTCFFSRLTLQENVNSFKRYYIIYNINYNFFLFNKKKTIQVTD